MTLPENVLRCITRLEDAGFETWAVGGCVRDALLGLTPNDYDLCTAALPEQVQAVFSDGPLVLAGVKHGTVGVVTEGGLVEITTFRREGSYADHRRPDWVAFVPSLRQDLARRDFTINAMAYSPARGLNDPFGGAEDLHNKVLRAVGDPERRFTEDALRILRALRFSVRFGLTIEDAAMDAMVRLAPLCRELAWERVYRELCGLLPLVTAEDLLRFSPVLTVVVPELAPAVGFDQRSPHHGYDLYTHIAHVTATVPGDLTLRWAALLHDIGKIPTFTLDENGRGHFYGHAERSAAMAEDILRRLTAPNRLREDAVCLIKNHMVRLAPDRKSLRRLLSRLGPDQTRRLLQLQQADNASKGVGEEDSETFRQLYALLDDLLAEENCFGLRDLAVKGGDLMALGITVRQIGSCLRYLLGEVLDERAPNGRQELLDLAAEWAGK